MKAMDIKGMWSKLVRDHPDDIKNCQLFEYGEHVTKLQRKRKIFPSDSELLLEAQKPLPKVTAYVRTPKTNNKK